MKFFYAIILAAGSLMGLISWPFSGHTDSADRVLLLLPDGTNFSDPKVTLWLDAASEEGLHVVPMHDSDFVRPFFSQPACAGIILPDQVHQRASDIFIADIRRYVNSGGRLMLVYDAGTLTPEGKYARGYSRLSDLAGVDYALYDRLQDKTIQWSPVSADIAIAREFDIPPGKYYPLQTSANQDIEVQIKRYKFGQLKYPSFATEQNYSGQVLFHSAAGVAVGEHNFGQGSVFFVNLPLGYLKANTDGLPLHIFLHYFGEHVLSLPYLMSVPDGVGGIVLNWHVDSNAAIKPLEQLRSWTLLQQGKFSVHITAGPDSTKEGDHDGFDVPNNPLSQQLIRELVARGDEIGSHGGWMHDFFALHVDTDPPASLEKYLAQNKSALEAVTGKPVVEYSAPDGNQPEWVTQWLDQHGFLAYYYTGDSGMAPTQGYRDGSREGQNVWAFPISHLNTDAAFEEMARHGYSSPEVQIWLDSLAQFTADHRTARLVYFHPPGILGYHAVVDHWMQQTSAMRAAGRFRWYTMTDLARFLTSRKQVDWKTSTHDGVMTIAATQSQDLEHETWRLPSSRFSEPVVTQGNGHVSRDDNSWLVIAGPGKALQFESKMVSQ